jgi:hypothetical protein
VQSSLLPPERPPPRQPPHLQLARRPRARPPPPKAIEEAKEASLEAALIYSGIGDPDKVSGLRSEVAALAAVRHEVDGYREALTRLSAEYAPSVSGQTDFDAAAAAIMQRRGRCAGGGRGAWSTAREGQAVPRQALRQRRRVVGLRHFPPCSWAPSCPIAPKRTLQVQRQHQRHHAGL